MGSAGVASAVEERAVAAVPERRGLSGLRLDGERLGVPPLAGLRDLRLGERLLPLNAEASPTTKPSKHFRSLAR
jgi:hypothetical protein